MGNALGVQRWGVPLRSGRSRSGGPPDMANLKVWLKADAGTFQDSALTTPAAANNDPVGGWVDQSGSGNNVLQATAGKRPLLKTAAQNGLSMLTFDGVDDFLQRTYGVALSQPVTLFFCGNIRSNVANYYHVDDATAGVFAFRHLAAGDNTLINAGLNCQYTGDASPTGFAVWSGLFNGASSLLRRDRVQKVAANAGANTSTGCTVGSSFNGTQSSPIDVGEILIYGADETLNFSAIETYLQGRWGTP